MMKKGKFILSQNSKGVTLLIMKVNLILVALAMSLFIVNCNLPKNEADKTEEIVSVEQIVDVKSIAGKPLSEVEEILGSYTSKEETKVSGVGCKDNICDKYFYKDGEIEIVFINGLADWITIYKVDHLTRNKNLIQALGIEQKEPTIKAKGRLAWENIEGIKSISIFNDLDGKIQYIYIQSNTVL
ncbi:MAG: hypothetical protein IIA45_12595 [Bacteroidetes bacterium]|nr:hypothetical protein [Bacteroidota bacterium]